MAVPKKKRSRSRKRQKLSAYLGKAKTAKLTTCSHCKEPVVSHRACSFCGYYKDKQVIDVEAKEKKKREKAKKQEKKG